MCCLDKLQEQLKMVPGDGHISMQAQINIILKVV